MAESSQFTDGDYFQACFDPRAYINTYYRRPEGHSYEKEYPGYILGCLSRTFLTGQIKGCRLIDVGSGPTIHAIISACEHFDELVLSDFTDRNREEIEKWLKNEEGCFDWKPFIEYVCKLDGKRSSDVEAKLRQRVRRVLKCNVLSDNMFHPESIEPAECVITSLCLEVACKDLPTYRDALCRVAKLVSPGGALVIIGVFGETFFYVDKVRFSCLKLSKENIEEIIRNLGFTLQEFEVFPAVDRESNKIADCEAFFFLTALKPNKST